MTRRRGATIAAIVGGAAMLAACQGENRTGNANVQAGNVEQPANEQIPIIRPIEQPTPVPLPAPTTTPSPRSIMQPSIQPSPTPTPVKPLDLTIHFAKGGVALDDAAKAALDDLLAAPVMADGGAITLRGASDSKGDDAVNLRVSRKRAEAVAAYLEDKGIAADRMTVIALGEGRPVAPDVNLDGTDNPAGREANRRVEMHVEPAARPAPAPAPTPPAKP